MASPGVEEHENALTVWPKRGVDRALAGVCALVVVCSAVLLLTYPFGRDQGIFAVIGEGILHGRMPYRDLWDVKTPGIFFVFALAEGLFGHTMLGPRLLESAALLVTACLFVDLGRRWFRDVSVGFFAAAILAILQVQLDFWHTSQPETYGGMMLVWASWLLCGTWPRNDWTRLLLGGILLGFIVMMKPHLGLAAPFIIWGAIRREPGYSLRAKSRDVLRILLGTGAVLGCTVVWLLARGAYNIAVWTWRDFAPGYSALGNSFSLATFHVGLYSTLITLVLQLSALLGVGLLLVLCLGQPKTPERRRFWWLVGQGVCLALAVLLQHKSFKYHYAAAFPILALTAGIGWAMLWRVATRAGWRYVPVFLILFGATYFMRFPVTDLQGSIHERTWFRVGQLLGLRDDVASKKTLDSLYVVRKDFDLANVQAVATWIKREVDPDESLLVWGCDSIIYWLSERRPATRFIHNIPQRSSWQAEEARRRLMVDIRRSRPRAIVVQHGDVILPVTGAREDSAGTIRLFPEFSEYLRIGYRREIVIGKFDVYVR
jgi:hypothetical protein